MGKILLGGRLLTDLLRCLATLAFDPLEGTQYHPISSCFFRSHNFVQVSQSLFASGHPGSLDHSIADVACVETREMWRKMDGT